MPLFDDFLIKRHVTFSAEPHVEDEAAWPGGVRRPEKFVRGLERFDTPVYGARKQVESLPDSLVVNDDVNDGTVGCSGSI
jgi:hypothetical protein